MAWCLPDNVNVLNATELCLEKGRALKGPELSAHEGRPHPFRWGYGASGASLSLCPSSARASARSHEALAGLAQIQRCYFRAFSCLTLREAIPAPGDPRVLACVFPDCL